MAMSSAAAKADLKAKLQAAFADQGKSIEDDALLTKVCEAFGNWLYNQITTTAVVQVTGVQTGGGSANGTIT